MNKAILMSIQPQQAVNILKGKKTLELRKTVPKNFKGWVYIYVTKAKPYLGVFVGKYNDYYYKGFNAKINLWQTSLLMSDYVPILNGKVVARFWFDETYYITQSKNVYGDKLNQISIYDNKNFGWKAPKEQQETLKQLCLTQQQVLDYGKGKELYAWHIKNLEIFNEPKELSEFYIWNKKEDGSIGFKIDGEGWNYLHKLKKAPQSWQFVYVEGEEG